MKRHRALICLMLAILIVATPGCQSPEAKPGPPPLKISFRKSNIPTQGMVAGINNTSSTESLKVIVMYVGSATEEGERSYRLDRIIAPLDSISVGWVELDGWKLKEGDHLRVECEGYQQSFESEVP